MTRTNSMLLTFVIGGIVGAGAALLLAPASGTETRKRIKEGVGDAGDWVRERAADARTRAEEGTSRVRQIVKDEKESLRAAYDAGKEAYLRGKESHEKEKAL